MFYAPEGTFIGLKPTRDLVVCPTSTVLTCDWFSDDRKAHESKDDFYHGFDLDDEYDFSDKLSQSTLLMDTDSQLRSELDSSFSKLSDVDSLDEPQKNWKQLSSFSKFKNDKRRTADISVDGSDNGSEVAQEEVAFRLENSDEEKQNPIPKPQKKRRRRRDVVFKRILRECRRFFQIQLSDLTGFVASKKPRKDDYIYRWMERFNMEFLDKEGTFEENFYLACLLYPQDLARNVDIFIAKKEVPTKENHKAYKAIVAKIHDTLYKYSHDKLDYFVSIPELSNLFLYFYHNGAGTIRTDPKLQEELEHIKNKWEEAQM